MSGSGSGRGPRRRRAGAPEEETRYRVATELDVSDPEDRATLLGLLADASWRVRTAAAERLASAPDPGAIVPKLVAALAGGDTIGERDAAASALGRIGAPAVPALLEALSGADPDLRLAAAPVLGAIGDRRAAAPLAARLPDPDPNVRAAAAEALGKIGGTVAVATLAAALDSDDTMLRLAALEGLAALRACPPVDRIEPLLGDRNLRRSAYRVLGASDAILALPLLARGLTDPARGTREAALLAIGMQRSRRPRAALEPLERAARELAARDGGVSDACAAALGSEQPFVAVGALTVLAWTAAPRHVPAMLRLAEDDRLRPLVEDALESLPPGPELRAALAGAIPDQGPFGRIATLAALARLGSPAALESVIREASDPDAPVQGEAIAALGRLGDGRAVAPLAGLLGDATPGVANRAASALLDIARRSPDAGGHALAAARVRAEASPSPALYRLLGALGDAADLPRVRAGVRSDAAGHRAAAATALAALGGRGFGPPGGAHEVVEALSDPAWQVRVAAARACRDLARASRDAPRGPGAEAVAALRGALRDPEAAVRAAAAEALGASGQGEHAAAIAELIRGGEAPAVVLLGALRALVELRAVPGDVIALAAGHRDPEVVKEAVSAAARLPGEDGERMLRAAARNPRWDVRRAAAAALEARADPALREEAARLAAEDPDPLVARAFADAAAALARS